MNYYNEWDNFAAEWLRELIKDGLIPDGEVDTRSIADVRPEDLKGFTQCHFFAGIGGWSRALQLAGWSPDRPVWTGSPPCQPFSTAGKQSGKDDLRHLWPAFFNLIRECSPPTIFGEQVASAIRFGWLDDLQRDLEAEGYAAAAVVLPGGAVSAPHKRDRLFFVANSCGQRLSRHWGLGKESLSQRREGEKRHCTKGCSAIFVGNAEHDGSYEASDTRGVVKEKNKTKRNRHEVSEQLEGTSRSAITGDICFWEDSEVIYCRDGKCRPIPTEPALFPLANGISNRVGILRGAGNAIVPQAAAEIIKAVM